MEIQLKRSLYRSSESVSDTALGEIRERGSRTDRLRNDSLQAE